MGVNEQLVWEELPICMEGMSGEAMMNGEDSGGGTIVAAGFVEDVSEMMSDGFFAQCQFSGNFGIG